MFMKRTHIKNKKNNKKNPTIFDKNWSWTDGLSVRRLQNWAKMYLKMLGLSKQNI